MSNIKHSVEELIGNTPLFEIDHYESENNLKAKILLKMENMNPIGSLKDRIAAAMIDDVEKNTNIKKGDYLVEASSGNTAIALAAIGRKRGYRVLTILEQPTQERLDLLTAYGAEIVDIEQEPDLLAGMYNINENYRFHDFLYDYYKKKSEESEVNYYVMAQWANKANPQVQYETTAQEIIRDTDGKVDVFIAGIGSGGSIRGIGDALREVNPNLEIIAFDSTPEEPDSLIGVHKIEGQPLFALPVHVTEKEHIYDRTWTVTKEDAYRTANKLAQQEGIFLGVSTGAAVYLATQLAKLPEYEGKTILAIAYDDVLKYLSTDIIKPEFR